MIIDQAFKARRGPGVGHFAQAQRWAAMYDGARNRGWRGQLWSRLVRTSRGLIDLGEVESKCDISERRDVGRCAVPITQIKGSAGRVADFDRDFNPLKGHTRNRWLGIVKAREQGVPLPPVSLVRVGDTYFVADGHHRISVAAACGQQDIEARVVVWEVKGPLPWEARGQESSPASGLAGVRAVFGALRRAAAHP